MSLSEPYSASETDMYRKPDINYLPISQIDFGSVIEKTVFDHYLYMREQLYGREVRNVTIADIIHTGNLYLLRNYDGKVCPISAYETAVRPTNGGYRVMLCKYPGGALTPGDKIYMFVKPDVDELEKTYAELPVRLIRPVQNRIINTLFNIGAADYDFTKAAEFLGKAEKSLLFEKLSYDVCFAVIPSALEVDGLFAQSAPEHCAAVIRVGTISKDFINIKCGQIFQYPVDIQADFPQALDVKLSAHAFCPSSPSVIRNIEYNSRRVISSASNISCDGFYFGYYSVISLINRLACRGISKTDCSYTYNSASVADSESTLLSRALGVFYAAINCGITIRFCPDFIGEESVGIVSAVCDSTPFPSIQTATGALYRLTPLYDKDGLICNSDYDSMLSYLGFLRRNNNIKFAFTIEDISDINIVYNSDITESEKSAAYPGSVYVVSDKRIEGKLIGTLE